MEGRPFYTVGLTPNWSSKMFGTTYSGTPVLGFYTVWDYVFQLYGIVGKDFVSNNNLCGNIVTVFEEHLKLNHHSVSEIVEVCVIFHCLCKNVAWIDYARNVFDLNIFWLMTFSKPYFLGGLGDWLPLRLLKPPIERCNYCCSVSWCKSMPLEFQYFWQDVSVTDCCAVILVDAVRLESSIAFKLEHLGYITRIF